MRRWILTVVLAFVALTLQQYSITHAQVDPASPITIPLDRALAIVRAANDKLNYVPGEVLVRFKDGVARGGQQRALQALRSAPSVDELTWIGETALFVDQTESDATVLAEQLARQTEVLYAEPNYIYKKVTTPNDPGFSTSQWNFKAIDLPRAWDINPGASNRVTVAVIDYGVTSVTQTFSMPVWNGLALQAVSVPFRVNPDLAQSRLVAPRDFVSGSATVLDMDGHGTHVSSTIGEDTNNALGEAGIAYQVKIMPVKVCEGYWDVQFSFSAGGIRGFAPLDAGGCPTATIAAGIRYATDNGAQVINVSLGGVSAPPLTIRDALIYAVQKGVFVAIAAGNDYDNGNPTT